MHDDQHGTAIVLLAALRGACAVQGRPVDGPARRRLRARVRRASPARGSCSAPVCATSSSSTPAACSTRPAAAEKAALAAVSNPRGVTGGIAEALAGADVFVGLSGGTLPEELLALMAPEAIVFALSNPDPEVQPDVARRHAAIVATGRSDFPNQINNVLAFPGVFRGALDAGARRITERMKIAAADAIFAVAQDDLARTGSCRARSTRGSRPRSPRRWRRRIAE